MTISRKLPQYIVFFIGTLFFSILAVTGITFGISAIAGVVDGSLDPYFQNGKYEGFDDMIYTVSEQSDGKIIVGGGFISYRGVSRNHIARLNVDGSLDTTFNIDTGFDSWVRKIIVQPDGKILVAGDFTSYNDVVHSRLIRLNSDGSPDTSFSSEVFSGGNNGVYTISRQSDGKILVGGSFEMYGGVSRRGVVRIDIDGSLDSSFDPGSGIGQYEGISVFKTLSNGQILIGGGFSSYNGVLIDGIARINSDGSLDETFDSGSGLSSNGHVSAIEVQADDKYLVGGWFESYNEVACSGMIRLNVDGSLDSTFDTGSGMSQYADVNSIVILSSEEILVGGRFSIYNGVPVSGVMRVNSVGIRDSSFNSGGSGLDGEINAMQLLSNGKIIIGGDLHAYNGLTANYLAELNPNGSLSSEFDLGDNTGFNNEIYSIATQSDGKIVVGGEFTVFNNIPKNYIARLNEDGTLDTSFIQQGSGFDGGIVAIAIQSDGKILVGGYFSSYNGFAVRNFARLNGDGTLDTAFVGLGESFNSQWNYVNNIIVLPDGAILICGEFYDGDYNYVILKLQSDGSIEEAFAENSLNIGGSVYSMAPQSDGKIVIAGDFWNYDESIYLKRLNSDGSLDSTFSLVGTGFDRSARFVTTQPDGKILVGGEFQNYNSIPVSSIARLNNDGTLDETFNFTGYDNIDGVYAIAVQNDGKIFLGGYFWDGEEQETNITSFVRLNSDGSLDSVFDNSGIGGDSWPRVNVIKIQLDGKVLVGGYFMSYAGTPVAFITRLGFTDILPPSGGVAINSNANSTTNRNVTLTLSASDNLSGVSQMMICNNSSFVGCTWQTYATSKAWTLDSGLGTKTIYVKYKDGIDLESQVYTDIIRLVAPTVVVPVETVVETPLQPIEVIPTPEIVTTVIQILDNNGKAIVGARVEIEGNQYVTDSNGRIQVQGSTKGKSYSAKISYNGKTYTHEVLGASDNEKKIILDSGQADLSTSEQYSFEWKKALLYGSIIVAFVIGTITFSQIIKRKKNL